MSTLISAGLKKSFESKTVIHNVSLEVNSGEVVGLLGPNGAGKSMLLKCLMGFYKPNSGAIKTKPNLKFGYMPQNLDVIKTIPMKAKLFITIKKKNDGFKEE